ncbi:tyrosine-type recombinase/integrase [Endozoicomonas ascidiicola]|uniref:tyrosine-type recombinase/integrase n=1 Tax=Endozoicomonas ascidiicola TaxID=1698521 RepID=UPI00083186D7|nr:tyrosine-type recombinase/integrase [Endozoicomonas ascidiicola]
MNKNNESDNDQADEELLLIESWLTWLLTSRGRASSTVNKYRGHLKQLQVFLGERDRSIFQADQKSLTEFTGLWLHKQGIAPQSRHVVVAACRGFYEWLHGQRLISDNPSSYLLYPSVGRKLPRQLGLMNAEQLLMQADISSFNGVRDAAMLALLMGTGMRVAGLVSLNQESLYWFEHNGVQRLGLIVSEKGENERELPLPNEAALLLQAYLGHDELQQVDRTLPSGERVLFVSVRNRRVPEHEYRGEARRLSTKSVWKMIQGYGAAAGLPKELCHPHAFRHMMGAEMMEEESSTLQVQAVLGHADPKTSEIYARIARKKLTDVIDKTNPLGKITTAVTPLVQEMKKRGTL